MHAILACIQTLKFLKKLLDQELQIGFTWGSEGCCKTSVLLVQFIIPFPHYFVSGKVTYLISSWGKCHFLQVAMISSGPFGMVRVDRSEVWTTLDRLAQFVIVTLSSFYGLQHILSDGMNNNSGRQGGTYEFVPNSFTSIQIYIFVRSIDLQILFQFNRLKIFNIQPA